MTGREQWTADYRRARLVRGFEREVRDSGAKVPTGLTSLSNDLPLPVFKATSRPADCDDPLAYSLDLRRRLHRLGHRIRFTTPALPAAKEH